MGNDVAFKGYIVALNIAFNFDINWELSTERASWLERIGF
jgi:hypothetical protein